MICLFAEFSLCFRDLKRNPTIFVQLMTTRPVFVSIWAYLNQRNREMNPLTASRSCLPRCAGRVLQRCFIMIAATVDNTYGSAVIGGVLAGIFYGMTCAQMYHYFKSSNEDTRYTRITMASLWLFDTVHVVFVTWDVYYFAVSHSADPSFGGTLVMWLSGALVTLSYINVSLIRIIFLGKILGLSRNRILSVIPLVILCTATTGFGLSYGAKLLHTSLLHSNTFSWLLYTTISSDAASDVFISASLFLLFRRLKCEAQSAHELMQKLMFYAVNTGLLQSSLAMAVLITYATMPRTGIYIAIFFVYPKASLNTLLAALNARPYLREMVPSPALLRMVFDNTNLIDTSPPMAAVDYGGGYQRYRFMSCPDILEGRTMVERPNKDKDGRNTLPS
ncbi:hypothetical protein BXZ70DRAFT_517335 [Cristinia sonorae]|uniref:DUF6534 domain-containing protein n=1 Tax=Cristinia sonorae TaxID=1940300 RepID=A0A8K0UVJ3_9AGAR|nr:hypothetical protein BXZ70DRAFT_517335 [Cristinia sonorae]